MYALQMDLVYLKKSLSQLPHIEIKGKLVKVKL